MAFPDRIERTLDLPHAPARVWAALTTAEGLAGWFGDEASIDLRPGGSAEVRWREGGIARLRVERVDEPTTIAFTWHLQELDADDPRRTHVEFTLEPVGDATRLTVVETGFAQLPDDHRRAIHDDHVEGWARELGELGQYLDA